MDFWKKNIKKLLPAILFLSFSILPFTSFSKIDPEEVNRETSIDNSIIIARISNDDIEVAIPSIIFTFNDAEIKLKFKNPEHTRLLLNKNKINFIINGEEVELNFINGEASFKKQFDTSNSLTIYAEEFSYNHKITAYPLWLLLSPFLIIAAIMILRMWLKNKK